VKPTKQIFKKQLTIPAKRVGLARALSKLGHCSRTQAFVLIREGKVRLNRDIVRNPEAPVRLGVDKIEVEGRRVRAAAKLYLMMNKPRGIVTTAADERGRDTVYSLLSKELAWIAPVGRLDKASEGLLLLTNDSEWSALVTDPATHLDKTYHVQVGTVADESLLKQLVRGVETENGEVLGTRKARVVRAGEKNSWIELVLDEGKNRQIRRMFDALGIEVLKLFRVAIGPLELGDLAKGAYRPLNEEEKERLDRAMGKPMP
jgi:23S rRNA pseudouridine2605 synthase